MHDYQNYSIAELREALAGVDGDLHPDNKAALEAELQRRKDSGEYDRELDRMARELANREADKRRRAQILRTWLAYYLIGTGPLVWLMTSAYAGHGSVRILDLVVLLFAAASITAGVGILRGKAWGHWLAVGVFALQLVRIQTPTMVAGISSALMASVSIDASFTLSAGFAFLPGLQFLLGPLGLTWGISVDLFAIGCLSVLFKAREADRAAESDEET